MEEYEVDRVLGSGAFGTVVLVRSKATGEQLALKKVPVEKLSHADRAAAVREVHIISSLRHPNIVGYADAFIEDGELCILLELADGGTLEDRLRDAKQHHAPFNEDWIIDIFLQLGDCLNYMHTCRILHRDIKPANVLMVGNGTPKLADFGISLPMLTHEAQVARELRSSRQARGARAVGNLHELCPDELRESKIEGTPLYLAPELFDPSLELDSSQYTRATDVWALGVLLFEMLTLDKPYKGESVVSLAYRVCSDRKQNAMRDAQRASLSLDGSNQHAPALAASYSPHLCAAVEAMLHKLPRRRATLPELLGRAHFAQRLQELRGEGAPLAVSADLTQMRGASAHPALFSWGRGCRLPRLREDFIGLAVVQIACGAAHCAVVCDTGAAFTWGENSHGELGHGDRSRLSRRRRVLSLVSQRVVGASCGREHTLFHTATRALYACGSNELGQCGLPLEGTRRAVTSAADCDGCGAAVSFLDAMRCALSPVEVESADVAAAGGVVATACGEGHSAALGADGRLLTWGLAEDGRLGLTDDELDDKDIVDSPSLLPSELCFVELACGDDFTICIGSDALVYGCGANISCQLSSDPDEEFPQLAALLPGLEGTRFVQVSCGADHVAAVDSEGALWVWGGRFGEEPARVDLPAVSFRDSDGIIDEALTAETRSDRTSQQAACGLDDGEQAGLCEGKAKGKARDEERQAVESDGGGVALVACGAGVVLAVSRGGDSCFTWGDGAFGRLGHDDGDADHDAPTPLRTLSAPVMCVKAAACGRGLSSLGEGPYMLALALPAESTSKNEIAAERYLMQACAEPPDLPEDA